MHKAMIIAMLAAVTSWGAVEFDNTNYLRCEEDTNIPTGGSDITWAAWVYPTGWDVSFWSTIVAKAGAANYKGWFFGITGDTATPQGRVHLRNQANMLNESSTGTIPLNEWSHVAAVYHDTATEIDWYINGEYDSTDSGGFDIQTTTQAVTIAVDSRDYSGYEWEGMLDDIRVYDAALTSNQIASIIIDTCDKFVPALPYLTDVITDSAGAYDGTPEPTKETGPQPCGGWLGSYLFDGVDDSIPVGFPINLSTQTDVSISAWVRTTASSDSIIYEQGGGGGGIALAMSAGGARAYARWSGGGSYTYSASGPVINDGNWHLVTATFDESGGSTGLFAYVDGQTTSAGVSCHLPGSQPGDEATIGNDNGNGVIFTGDWSGNISDVRVYDDLLTTAEQEYLLTFGASGDDPTDDDLLSNWKLCPVPSDLIANQDPGFDTSPAGLIPDTSYVHDYSGNANHGTLQPTVAAGPTYTASDGERDGFYDFDGVDQYVAISDSADIKPQNLSLAAWFKTSNSSSDSAVYRYRAKGYGIHIWSTGAVVGMMSDGSDRNAVSATGFNDGDWHHAVMTYDHSYVRIYVDGELEDSLAETSDIVYSGGYAAVGRHGNYAGGYFDGGIDDVRLYHSILTTNQIAALYQGTAPTNEAVLYMPMTPYPTNRLVAMWDSDYLPVADGNAITGTWYDATGNGNDATAVNSPTREAAR